MKNQNRRRFLADVGRGMLLGSVGTTTALDPGLTQSFASEPASRITFGAIEPLVSLMQESSPDELLPKLVDRLNKGTTLSTLVSAGALANVRAFAGQDYIGFHTFMALLPALQMSSQLPHARQALPVLKVLHRNSRQIQSQQRNHEHGLHVISAANTAPGTRLRRSLRAACTELADVQSGTILTGPIE